MSLQTKFPVEIKNINYYEQMLNSISINNINRNYYQNLLTSIKKQGGWATPNQYHTLQNLKRGGIKNETVKPKPTTGQKTSCGKTVVDWDADGYNDTVHVTYSQGDEEFQEEETFQGVNDVEINVDYPDTHRGTMQLANDDNSRIAIFDMWSKSGNSDNPDWVVNDLVDIVNTEDHITADQLVEGVKLNKTSVYRGGTITPEGDEIQVNFVKGLDNPQDDLVIHRDDSHIKKMGYDVYYGLKPGQIKSHQELVDLSNKIKSLQNISPESLENLKKIVINSAPHLPITHIVAVNSKHPLVRLIVEILKQKYRSTLKGSADTKKVGYDNAWDMVNLEKFNQADPTTQRIVKYWIQCVEKNFQPPYTINKSGINGKCGLQSGGRHLLNKTHDIEDNQSSHTNKYLVVDDVIIGGSTFKDIFGSLAKNPYISNKNLYGYTLINLL